MNDDALMAWLSTGGNPVLSPEEVVARRRSDFNIRFLAAISPFDDLGITQEHHDMAVANNVFEIHAELCKFGDEEYNGVWRTLSASSRASIKTYIELAKKEKP